MNDGGTRKHLGLLKAGRWFYGLPRELQDELLDAGRVRSFAPEAPLFSRGDPPNGLFGVLQGAVRVANTGDNGEEALLTLVAPPTWIGEIGLLDGQPRSHDAVAECEVLAVHVSHSALLSLLERTPRYWREFGMLAASKLRLAFLAMEDSALLPISVQLPRRLVLMAQAHGDWRDRSTRVIEARQAQLAKMLSTSRQTVNQLLKGLEAQGLLRLAYGQIEIVDFDGLRRVAGFEAEDAVS